MEQLRLKMESSQQCKNVQTHENIKELKRMVMEKKQAINLLAQVCANFRGTMEEHKLLQEALQTVSEEEKQVKEDKKNG